MKFNRCMFCCLVFLLVNPGVAQETSDSNANGPWLMESATHQSVTIEQLAEQLTDYQCIFLGEQHDNDAGHEFQLQVIEALLKQDVDVVISMEQFERDVQGVLNDYLAERISEEEFLAGSRPWPNYAEHYRPIVELAKAEQIPVLAGNVPRRLAAAVGKGDTPASADRVFMPRNTYAPEDSYWEKFQESMQGHGGTGSGEQMQKFYAAQCLKDDAMAEAITDYLAVNPHRSKVVVHLCGKFHSDYGFGTAIRVVERRPLTNICVVTMQTLPENGEPDDDAINSAAARGHYVFWTVNNSNSEADK
ncbi:MAG: ChaN family lipoprotein [Pirellulaceae bacterium]